MQCKRVYYRVQHGNHKIYQVIGESIATAIDHQAMADSRELRQSPICTCRVKCVICYSQFAISHSSIMIVGHWSVSSFIVCYIMFIS